MRYVVSQLLLSAIMEDSSQFIAINAIEPYGRYVLEDAHHERRFTPQQSTFPTKEGTYGCVHAFQVASAENELIKFHVASRTCDLLIVSSHRLNQE
jgi:hypothetical protein